MSGRQATTLVAEHEGGGGGEGVGGEGHSRVEDLDAYDGCLLLGLGVERKEREGKEMVG